MWLLSHSCVENRLWGCTFPPGSCSWQAGGVLGVVVVTAGALGARGHEVAMLHVIVQMYHVRLCK